MRIQQTLLTQKPQSPGLKIDLPDVTTKRSFTLRESTLKLIADYARYLSDHHGQKVDEDLVLESLVKRLSADKGFRSWRQENGE